MARVIFWISFAYVFYVYFGYPLLLSLWRRIGYKPVHKGPYEPAVSIVIAAHNEREYIRAKILNCLELNYPRDKLELIVSLDGSTDDTEQIARGFKDDRVTVIVSPLHSGKAAALKRAVLAARGNVILFADARQRIQRDAVRELVANFHDHAVGAVSGELILLEGSAEADEDTTHPMGLYWQYDKWLRTMESCIHSCVGTTGALYAIRRELFGPLPDDTILDDVLIPMRIVLQGKRVIFEPAAHAYDRVACCPEEEFRRKVRTLTGNYQLLKQLPNLLLFTQNPVFLQFISHKIGRLLVPYFLAALFLSNSFLLRGFYLIPFILQVGWYLLALAGQLTLLSRQTNHAHKPLAVGRS